MKFIDEKPLDSFSNNFREVNPNSCKLKIASPVWTKSVKYEEYLKKDIVQSEDIKIVCVNVKTFGAGHSDWPYMMSVLYGIEENMWVNTTSYDTGRTFIKQKPIVKKSGAEINMGLFVQEKCENIDGVLCFDYGLGQIEPSECNVFFYANSDRKNKLGHLFHCWQRIFYENKMLRKEAGKIHNEHC